MPASCPELPLKGRPSKVKNKYYLNFSLVYFSSFYTRNNVRHDLHVPYHLSFSQLLPALFFQNFISQLTQLGSEY